ncbi:hypothetical protein V7793_24175 [Streptomyces sp. KLMMK]|uniref:hypothetical protein n=1 Tax=Streptomyces sp. KLMMK TaxID=3109353 RepID=UPI00300A3094
MPVHLARGQQEFFAIDLRLTSGSAPISGQKEMIWVEFPVWVEFPKGGKVYYHPPKKPREELAYAPYDEANRRLQFTHAIHLGDHTDEADGYYSVNVQVLPGAPEDLLWGRLGIGTATAPLRIQVGPPGPHPVPGNLIRNGGFADVRFRAGKDWRPLEGVLYGYEAQQLDAWTVGRYKGRGVWEPSKTGEPGRLIDLINGDADGHFPADAEPPFGKGENAVDINGDNTCGFIEQTVDVTPGAAYELAFLTGYHVLPNPEEPYHRPTYLRAEVRCGKPGAETVLAQEDYVQYYTGKGAAASHDSGKKLNDPGWRGRRLPFRVPQGVTAVTVRFANPGRSGFNKELDANPDGSSGMLLAHVRLGATP